MQITLHVPVLLIEQRIEQNIAADQEKSLIIFFFLLRTKTLKVLFFGVWMEQLQDAVADFSLILVALTWALAVLFIPQQPGLPKPAGDADWFTRL